MDRPTKSYTIISMQSRKPLACIFAKSGRDALDKYAKVKCGSENWMEHCSNHNIISTNVMIGRNIYIN